MAKFNMKTDALVDTAVKIRKLKQKISGDFLKVNTGVNKSKNAYKSPYMNDYIAKYNQLKPELEEYEKAVEEYSRFLEKSADIVMDVERKLYERVNGIENNALSEWK